MWLQPSNGLVYRVVDFVGGDDGDGCVVDPGCGAVVPAVAVAVHYREVTPELLPVLCKEK